MELCELKEKKLTRYLQHDTNSTVKHEFHRPAHVMQLCVNIHMTYRIVGCRIICNIFHSCNTIIIQC